jgi:4-hydroxy 2-oxovalerate aldolase
MMCHMTTVGGLVEEARKMASYGASGVIVMDSAGALLIDDVRRRVSALIEGTHLQVGYHGHENVSLGVANSIAAVEEGATILDGTARGFGAGAGNTQLEVLVAVLGRLGHETGIDLYKLLDAADLAERRLVQTIPTTDSITIVSGLAGVFSGYSRHVRRIAGEFGVDPRDVFFRLGEREVIAGQEDVILEVAAELQASVQVEVQIDVQQVEIQLQIEEGVA